MADKPTYNRNHSQNGAENQYQWMQGQIIEADLLNNMQNQIVSNTQGFSKLIEYNTNQPVSPYNQIWLKPTNRQEDTIRLAEVKDLDKVAIISDQQPDENLNKIWIHNSETGEYVPTYNEFTQNIENNIAPSYLNTATYSAGEYITYENKLYKCQTAVTTPGEWSSNSNHFIEASIAGPLEYEGPTKGGWPNINADILNRIGEENSNRVQSVNLLQNKVNNIENSIAPVYSEIPYNIGDYCMHDGKLYKCKSAIVNGEEWAEAHWVQVTTGDELGDLKSAFDNTDLRVFKDRIQIKGFLSDTNWSQATSSNYKFTVIEVAEGDKIDITYDMTGLTTQPRVGWLTEYPVPVNGEAIPYVTGDAGGPKVLGGGSASLTAPAGAKYLAFQMKANANEYDYTSVAVNGIDYVKSAMSNMLDIANSIPDMDDIMQSVAESLPVAEVSEAEEYLGI